MISVRKNRFLQESDMAKKKKQGRRLAALFCRLLGTAILVFVIAMFLPITVPQWMGYQIYNIVSGSMEPTIPIGSVVYVQPVLGRDIEENDIVAFMSGGEPVVHRVIENHTVEGELITKGDANETEDLVPIPYTQVIGIVTKHFPAVGQMMMVWSSNVGKTLLLCLALSGALFNIVAGRLR